MLYSEYFIDANVENNTFSIAFTDFTVLRITRFFTSFDVSRIIENALMHEVIV